MHGSLHLILANESIRTRDAAAREARLAASVRGPFSTLAARVVAAHGLPPRAVPGTAASLRGR
jgi:hypothetical protein